jgi:hypothetical protein
VAKRKRTRRVAQRRADKVRQPTPAHDPYQLSLLGGAVERRYRRMRPEIEAIPWGTLDADAFSPELVAEARDYWTLNSLNEYSSAGAIADVTAAMIAAQAPLDMSAIAARFVVDELSHAELGARVVIELGGAVPATFDPAPLAPPDASLRPIVRAGYYILEVFCAGESFSLAMAQHTARWPTHPMIAAVLRRIARDEQAHGSFGWVFLDWAMERYTDEERGFLEAVANRRVGEIREILGNAREEEDETLGWLPGPELRRLGEAALVEHVIVPLRDRGLVIS